MELDTLFKSVQAGFYLVAGFVAVLTYLSAKNGLLNTVNTEYHKRVIDGLSSLSEELYNEFDMSTSQFWGKDKSTKELVDRINEQARLYRHELLTRPDGPHPIGVPVTKIEQRLISLLNKYKSDPFLPDPIRSAVVSLLEGRLNAIQDAHQEAAEYYIKTLSEGKQWDNLNENHGWLHNRINAQLYSSGFGISQVEERVHDIRLKIKRYFGSFNPLPSGRF
jgi:hypothetical protein